MRQLFRGAAVTALAALVVSSTISPTRAEPLPPRRPVAPTATVPSGFTDAAVATVSTPTGVFGMPDGRVVVLSKGGTVRIIKNGTLLGAAAITKSVCSGSEMGMLGFAVDPDFALNSHVYLYYTRSSSGAPGTGCVNRVSRFTMTGDTINNASEVVLLDNISALNGNHNGGDIEVGNDGYLYVAVGDAGCAPRSSGSCSGSNATGQDMSLLNGKMLRIDRFTGFAAPGNLVNAIPGAADCRVRGNTSSTPTTWCREIYANGLRNPWRTAFDMNTGNTRFFINDVGQGQREEVDLGILGANYGWNQREGKCATGYTGSGSLCPPPAGSSGFTQPINDYSHNSAHLDYGGEYITGGAFIPNGAWPSQYDGGYLFADGNPGRIFFRNAAGSVNYNAPFATGVGGIADINFVLEPSGWALYYVLTGTNAVRKVTYNTSPALPPTGLSYAPLATPARAYDSRNAGVNSGYLRAGTTRLIQLSPPSASAAAALVNITIVRPHGSGFVAAWAPRTTRPSVALVNGQNDTTVGNAAIVPVAADGTVVLMTSVYTDVVVDVMGFFNTGPGSVAAGRLRTLNPTNVVDTRLPSGGDNTFSEVVDGNDRVVTVDVGGRFDAPANATAVVLAVSAIPDIPPSVNTGGNVVVYPSGGTVPTIAHVTISVSDRRTNLVVVPMDVDGEIDLRLRGNADNVVVSIHGYFTAADEGFSDSGLLNLVAPSRPVDTRYGTGFGQLAAGGIGSVNPAVVPDTATALVHNIVTMLTGGEGTMSAYADNIPTGITNSITTAANQTRSALAITHGGTGNISYATSMSSHLVVDVLGYFTG